MIGEVPQDGARVVAQALACQPPERLPVFDGFWSEFETSWRSRRQVPLQSLIEDWYGIDLQVPVAAEEFFPSRRRVLREDAAGIYRDDGWGRVVQTSPGASFSVPVERLLNAPSDLDRIEFEPTNLDSRYDGLVKAAEHHRSRGRAVFVKIGGVFIRSSFFRGEPEFLMDLALDKDFARAVVERVAEHLLQIGLESLRRARAEDFGVWVFDDMCDTRGPMFSPVTFEEIFLPVYRRMTAVLKAAGARWVFLHCDGNLTPLLDHVVAAGFDGINPVEFGAGMDVCTLLPKYWGRLRFVGGICNTHILPRGNPTEVRAHVERIVDAGRNGGLVIGTHSIGPDITLETYELYRRTVSEHFAAKM